jgi:CRISPR-associated protein Csm2
MSISNTQVSIVEEITQTINNKCSKGLQYYPIRELVQQAAKLGSYLKNQRLETNQVRKFLDAVNRLKSR